MYGCHVLVYKLYSYYKLCIVNIRIENVLGLAKGNTKKRACMETRNPAKA